MLSQTGGEELNVTSAVSKRSAALTFVINRHDALSGFSHFLLASLFTYIQLSLSCYYGTAKISR